MDYTIYMYMYIFTSFQLYLIYNLDISFILHLACGISNIPINYQHKYSANKYQYHNWGAAEIHFKMILKCKIQTWYSIWIFKYLKDEHSVHIL